MWDYHHTHFELQDAQPELALLPLAATEPHGDHLPIGTDGLIIAAVAEGVAGRLPWRTYLLPPLPLGTSQMHWGEPGAVSLAFETLMQVVMDLVEALLAQDIRKVAVLNNHGLVSGTRTRPFGNYIVKTAVRQLNYDHPQVDAVWVQPFVAAAESLAAIFETTPDDVHAGEVETSLLLHLAPHLVRTASTDFVPSHERTFTDFAPLRRLAPPGVWGCPTHATAEKGAQALAALIEHTTAYITSTLETLARLKR